MESKHLWLTAFFDLENREPTLAGVLFIFSSSFSIVINRPGSAEWDYKTVCVCYICHRRVSSSSILTAEKKDLVLTKKYVPVGGMPFSMFLKPDKSKSKWTKKVIELGRTYSDWQHFLVLILYFTNPLNYADSKTRTHPHMWLSSTKCSLKRKTN